MDNNSSTNVNNSSFSTVTVVIVGAVFIFAIVALILNGFGLSAVINTPGTVIVDGQIVETDNGVVTGLGITQIICIILVLVLIVFIWFSLLQRGYTAIKGLNVEKPKENPTFYFNPFLNGKPAFEIPESKASDSICPVPKNPVETVQALLNVNTKNNQV